MLSLWVVFFFFSVLFLFVGVGRVHCVAQSVVHWHKLG